MPTTIRLDEQLLKEAKQMAARTGRTLTAVIEDALRAALARGRQRARPQRLDLPTFGGNGLVAGVDLDDTAALLDVMDRRGDPN
jgi:hypothetical protein